MDISFFAAKMRMVPRDLYKENGSSRMIGSFSVITVNSERDLYTLEGPYVDEVGGFQLQESWWPALLSPTQVLKGIYWTARKMSLEHCSSWHCRS